MHCSRRLDLTWLELNPGTEPLEKNKVQSTKCPAQLDPFDIRPCEFGWTNEHGKIGADRRPYNALWDRTTRTSRVIVCTILQRASATHPSQRRSGSDTEIVQNIITGHVTGRIETSHTPIRSSQR